MKSQLFRNKKILITAGPTREPIDPVRFISNHSSGKMGYALAQKALEAGAEVALISGPVSIAPPEGNIRLINIETAGELAKEAQKYFPECDIAILAAAVADYTPAFPNQEKLKKTGDKLSLELIKTPDTAVELGKLKTANQKIIGFALETENAKENARQKILQKNMDLIVINSLEDEGAGFSTATNKISIMDRHNKVFSYKLKSKEKVAEDILYKIAEQYET